MIKTNKGCVGIRRRRHDWVVASYRPETPGLFITWRCRICGQVRNAPRGTDAQQAQRTKATGAETLAPTMRATHKE